MDWAVWDNLQMVFERTGCRFIFVMDEWDAIFHSNFITESDKKHYLGFLRDMLIVKYLFSFSSFPEKCPDHMSHNTFAKTARS